MTDEYNPENANTMDNESSYQTEGDSDYVNGANAHDNGGQAHSGTGEDEDARKLFIGGISPNSTKEDVQNYFAQFGEVQMCTIKTDVYTGRSRGFGFLIFKDVSAVQAVLGNPGGHEINGKRVDPKLATPQTTKGPEEKSTKVFVGGLDKSFTKDDITSAFSQRGTVTDVYLPTDKMSGESKGFAFVTFDDSNLAETLCNEAKITISGKECDVRRANNKNESRGGFGGRGGRGMRGGGFRGGRGGRGGFQGGWGGYDSYGGGYGSGFGYDQYGGYGGGGYGGYGSFDQSGYTGGYDQSGGYGGGYGGGQGFDQSSYGGYGHDQGGFKMKARGGRGGAGYAPY